MGDERPVQGLLDPVHTRAGGLRAAAAVLAAAAAVLAALATTPAGPVRRGLPGGEQGASASLVSVILRVTPDSSDAVERAVSALDGRVTVRLPLIGGLAAVLPAGRVGSLAARPDVRSVSPDARVRLLAADTAQAPAPTADYGSLERITTLTGARAAWKSGYTGKGIDIALIDSGVSPVKGVTSGNVVDGPDLSFESQDTRFAHLDSFGHGTHMASIIAGRDAAATARSYAGETAKFLGMAPDARVVSVKVAAMDGGTDVSQVIAAIDWVSQHARDPGLNIRVLNLSFGTDSTQDWRSDPLSYAAEAAWRRGLVVVVAGGNDGTEVRVLADPARDPLVLAVGAQDPMGTETTSDDTVPDFATRGDSSRHVDLVAPAVHVLGLRVPGSYVDEQFPSARTATRFFRGSGTSQAAAVVSGAAALLLQKTPAMTPDDVKHALTASADPFPNASDIHRGSGALNVRNALTGAVANGRNNKADGQGTGSLELARGSAHVSDGAGELVGEQDIMGSSWDGPRMAADALAGRTWTGGTWNAATWTGEAWQASGWTGRTWTGATWAGRTWTGRTWTDASWAGRTWTSGAWTGGTWAGRTWTGAGWTSSTWASAGWR